MKIFRIALKNADGVTPNESESRLLSDTIFSSRQPSQVRLVHPFSVIAPRDHTGMSVPVKLDESLMFFSILDADAMVLWDANEWCDGIWFILTGSIHYGGDELSSGDWIFIPKGKRCSVRVGPAGATACYSRCIITR